LVSGEHAEPVEVRFTRDRQAALPVPAQRFDACVLQPALVDKYQTVRFDHNSYSVPRRWAFQTVTVKGYVGHVEVVAQGQVVARHVRCYGHGQRVLDPLHYLVTLERKPAALDHAPVYRDWQLPAVFAELRQELERRLGLRSGTRHFIRVLQLLAQHPLARVTQAIIACRGRATLDAPLIAAQVERLARAETLPSDSGLSPTDRSVPTEAARLAALRVPAPDLAQFNRLLSPIPQGGMVHDPTDGPAAAGQPKTPEAADHVG
jgi:hypothetical protein